MPVETIECQIVQAQLGRYLSGDAFSSEAMAELEAHLAHCPLCRQEVAQRRAALQALLGGTDGGRPTTDVLIEALRERTPQPQPETHAAVASLPSKTKPQGLLRPLMYGGGLAVVLIAMSYLGNNPTSLFGERAGLTDPANPASTAQRGTDTLATGSAGAIEIVAPLDEGEWTDLGLADELPYAAAFSATLEPWQWLEFDELNPIVEEPVSDTTEIEAPVAADSNPATLEDWELFGLAAVSSSPPATSTRRAARTPRRTVKQPTHTIRVYEP